MLKNTFNNEISEILDCLTEIKKNKNDNFKKLCLQSKKALKRGGKIIFCGNGGSASDAQHLAELVVKYQKKERH